MPSSTPSTYDPSARKTPRRLSRWTWGKRVVGLLVVISGTTIFCTNLATSATVGVQGQAAVVQHEHSDAE